MRVEPGRGHARVLALAREEVDEVDEDAGRHQDLEVVVLPGVDEPADDTSALELHSLQKV